MFLDPDSLRDKLDILENIEKASVRLVAQAIYNFREEAVRIFAQETDLQADIGEDVTREALDSMGMSRVPSRLFGKMDYKRACYVFHPGYAVQQALFVDSKAEKSGPMVIRLQKSQTSLEIRQLVRGQTVSVSGGLPSVISTDKGKCLTTTIFVKYIYIGQTGGGAILRGITIACLPNGMLQDFYNPNPTDNIWNVGPHAPTLGEEFRTRISCTRLQAKRQWRVQRIILHPQESFVWAE